MSGIAPWRWPSVWSTTSRRSWPPTCAPLFLTDGFREYLTALLTHYGRWVQPSRRPDKGPAPKPRWMPLPGLLYAQVVKTVRRRRLVDVKHRVVFGSLEAVNHILAPLGWHINTAFVERINLTIRQHVAAVGRRVSTLCRAKMGCGSSWPCSTATTISACPTRAYASPCDSPSPPTGPARPSSGGPVPQQWQPD